MALNKEVVVEEALKLLNEVGMDGVSLRSLANRLGVKPPTLYWHVKNKAVLINEMADSIIQPALRDLRKRGVHEPWQEWLLDVFRHLRQAMLSYTDGARVVAGAHFSLIMADLMENAVRTLLTAGVGLRESRLIVLTATHFTLGHVVEEQTPPDEEMAQKFDMEGFTRDHPTLIAGIEEYFNSGRTADDLVVSRQVV
ncbi:TetR/AcrR family transcriptional regulator C-terminal domain-containing protein [Alicyclobacillus fastidiosus]|uniref:TetR/AcrR family transcriptional regulator C-terminal domain-containing protein n=1 Tax=Alicyclobacillus fastidiosus TaxID=392011 RepID=A0ABV5A9W1_9BACL|nr:TetR/AcrR family transcriptional regulator C-terminal domain-containing protein [Alicyclobacillus fastidiosus]WEH07774.1 TetR/AcrR family transcriptional regulator C-terminal domain-containing protein [Alicyclobacillus fastidiosus]